ncbi:PRC-barrel domain-containing protein [Haladaptatus salinisoli]|uniref:PRC-barrel domain-containing protein n=1 Tax=Haladaptatus salinisoli TaxID=2884876 RepID=UPI001D0B11DC|nr:PRC-barrel domain-containing protein [Haladaptatus salinisoli]
MTDVFAGNIIGKLVMTSDGTAIGELSDITLNRKTGDLLNLVIIPDDEFDAEGSSLETNSQGDLQLSANKTRAIRDYIVIQHDLNE